MGFTDVAVQALTDRCTGMCWPKVTHYSKDQVLNWDAQLAEGIVQKAGQIPGRRPAGLPSMARPARGGQRGLPRRPPPSGYAQIR